MMVIAGAHSTEKELVEHLKSQYESIDDQDYVSFDDDSDADNVTQETTKTKTMDITKLSFHDVIQSKQTQEPIHTNTNGVNHSCQVLNNTYLVSIDNTNSNQETQGTSVSRKSGESSNQIELVEFDNTQHRNNDDEHYVSIEDENDPNDMTQETRITEAMNIKNLHHDNVNQSNQTQKPIHTNINGFNLGCHVQNSSSVVRIGNTNINQENPRKLVSKQTRSFTYFLDNGNVKVFLCLAEPT